MARATRARTWPSCKRRFTSYGYGVELTTTYGTGLEKVVEAFQRHFRTARIDGRADASTIATLEKLLAASGAPSEPNERPARTERAFANSMRYVAWT